MEQSGNKRGTKWKNVNSITVKFIKEKYSQFDFVISHHTPLIVLYI